MTPLDKMIDLAKNNLNNSSSKSSLEDAINLKLEGKNRYAARWALNSLAHSVGIFHSDYIEAKKLYDASNI